MAAAGGPRAFADAAPPRQPSLAADGGCGYVSVRLEEGASPRVSFSPAALHPAMPPPKAAARGGRAGGSGSGGAGSAPPPHAVRCAFAALGCAWRLTLTGSAAALVVTLELDAPPSDDPTMATFASASPPPPPDGAAAAPTAPVVPVNVFIDLLDGRVVDGHAVFSKPAVGGGGGGGASAAGAAAAAGAPVNAFRSWRGFVYWSHFGLGDRGVARGFADDWGGEPGAMMRRPPPSSRGKQKRNKAAGAGQAQLVVRLQCVRLPGATACAGGERGVGGGAAVAEDEVVDLTLD